MNINVDQIKQNACKALALIDLIERSQSKAKDAASCLTSESSVEILKCIKQLKSKMQLLNALSII